jgi:hypothetical protein
MASIRQRPIERLSSSAPPRSYLRDRSAFADRDLQVTAMELAEGKSQGLPVWSYEIDADTLILKFRVARTRRRSRFRSPGIRTAGPERSQRNRGFVLA